MNNNRFSRIHRIELSGVGKKFAGRWIIKDTAILLERGDRLLIEGPNGSGKSTLLQILAGYITPTTGAVRFYSETGEIETTEWFRDLSLAAPYMDLIEDFTLDENLEFYYRHKPAIPGTDFPHILEQAGLTHARNKQVKHFSSGMKQRLKLLLAFYADTSLLLLDEPLSNLDENGFEWYRTLIASHAPQRMLVVCSNQSAQEAFFCNKRHKVSDRTAG